MDDVCTYHIQIDGQIDEAEFNAMSPLKLTVIESGPTSTLFSARTDQAGLVGLIRHLHGLGHILRSVICLSTRENE